MLAALCPVSTNEPVQRLIKRHCISLTLFGVSTGAIVSRSMGGNSVPGVVEGESMRVGGERMGGGGRRGRQEVWGGKREGGRKEGGVGMTNTKVVHSIMY